MDEGQGRGQEGLLDSGTGLENGCESVNSRRVREKRILSGSPEGPHSGSWKGG